MVIIKLLTLWPYKTHQLLFQKLLTGLPHFIVLQRFYFLQIEGLWQFCLQQVKQSYFSIGICSLHIFASHFGNFHNISKIFIIIIFVTVICDITITLVSRVLQGTPMYDSKLNPYVVCVLTAPPTGRSLSVSLSVCLPSGLSVPWDTILKFRPITLQWFLSIQMKGRVFHFNQKLEIITLKRGRHVKRK